MNEKKLPPDVLRAKSDFRCAVKKLIPMLRAEGFNATADELEEAEAGLLLAWDELKQEGKA